MMKTIARRWRSWLASSSRWVSGMRGVSCHLWVRCSANYGGLEQVCCELQSQLDASEQHCLVAVREAEERGRTQARGAISTVTQVHSSLCTGTQNSCRAHNLCTFIESSLLDRLSPSFLWLAIPCFSVLKSCLGMKLEVIFFFPFPSPLFQWSLLHPTSKQSYVFYENLLPGLVEQCIKKLLQPASR